MLIDKHEAGAHAYRSFYIQKLISIFAKIMLIFFVEVFLFPAFLILQTDPVAIRAIQDDLSKSDLSKNEWMIFDDPECVGKHLLVGSDQILIAGSIELDKGIIAKHLPLFMAVNSQLRFWWFSWRECPKNLSPERLLTKGSRHSNDYARELIREMKRHLDLAPIEL